VQIKVGESAETEITVDRYWIKAVNENGERTEPDGGVELFIGSSLPDDYSISQGAAKPVSIRVK